MSERIKQNGKILHSLRKGIGIILMLALVFSMLPGSLAFGAETANIAPVSESAQSAAPKDMEGEIVILHTNDVHGAIGGYEKVAALKKDYEARGAWVLLLDAGDFSQGSLYVSNSKGAAAVELMNLAGYDAAVAGNHEFDFGYENLTDNAEKAKFKILSANLKYNGEPVFDDNVVFSSPDGKKVGVFGLTAPRTVSSANPARIRGVSIDEGAALLADARTSVKELKAEGCDYIICLGHLGVDDVDKGNRSTDICIGAGGIDLFIDGHSHVVIDGMTNEYETGDAMLVSTGNGFQNIGAVVLDGNKRSSSLISVTEDMSSDAAVKQKADNIMLDLNKEFEKVVAHTEVELDGSAAPGLRTQETNLGDLVADAFLWKCEQEDISVDAAVNNGGGIRAAIKAGDISMKDINTVLPFGNTLCVVKVTGSELSEAFESATFMTPQPSGAFPQVAGIEMSVDTTVTFFSDGKYPNSAYLKPYKMGRVKIESVGGKVFDENDTYTIVTNNFLAAGGDAYYVFSNASANYDLGLADDAAVTEYITEKLNGRITAADYGKPAGRIKIITPFTELTSGIWMKNIVDRLISGEPAFSLCSDFNLISGVVYSPEAKIQ